MLTGEKIRQLVDTGELRITPFNPAQLSVNSYDVRLAPTLYRIASHSLDLKEPYHVHEWRVPEEGFTLEPRELYLGVTLESIYAPRHVPIYEGRSTMARYFIQSHQTAGFCDIGWAGHLTLEITVGKPIRVYPGIRIGQVSFHAPDGPISTLYKGNYLNEHHDDPRPQVGRPGNL